MFSLNDSTRFKTPGHECAVLPHRFLCCFVPQTVRHATKVRRNPKWSSLVVAAILILSGLTIFHDQAGGSFQIIHKIAKLGPSGLVILPAKN